MAELRALPALPARALEFTILTAARTGEARFARWSEIDSSGGIWTIPGERMKSGKEHRVPLSDRALAILAELPRESGSDAVFPGRADGGFINQDAMADVLAKLRPGVTVHGFRSTFRDWAAETTHYPNHVLEMALAQPSRALSRPTGAATCSRSARSSWPNGPPIAKCPSAARWWCSGAEPTDYERPGGSWPASAGARVDFNPTFRGSP